MSPPTPHVSLQAVLAVQRPRVVALLARSLGLSHLALAEDALQTAVLRALERWPQQGLPANPAGWLYRVARHEAIDALRLDGRHDALPQEGNPDAAASPVQAAPAGRFAGELHDDELALLFAACHPAVPAPSQLAFALHVFTGLDSTSLAAVLLCTPAALAQRLARAREIMARQSLELPAGHQLAPRRDAVLTVLALAFHTGARARARSGGAGVDAASLCWESIRLARALVAHPVAGHPDADALAALLLLSGARLTGQLDAAGDIVLLPGQPRDRWDGGMLRMGMAHLKAAQGASRLSRWHLLAGIAAEHALAPEYSLTDWPAIVRYYETLMQMDPSAAPRLGHAIATAEAGDAGWARARLAEMLPEVPSALRAHALAAQARACERLGDQAAARALLQAALAAAPHPAEARALQRKVDALGTQART